MALKNNAMASRINNNMNQGKKMSIGTKKPLFTETIEYTTEEENNVIPINTVVDTTTSTTVSDEAVDIKTTKKSTQNKSTKSKEGFNPYIDKVTKKVSTKDDKEIKEEIESLILLSTSSVQTRCEHDNNNNMIQVNYFNDKENSVLLSNVIKKVIKLVEKLSVDNVEKNDYFNEIIDKFICDRMCFMIRIALKEHLTPAEIENNLKTFIQSGDEYIRQDVLDDYFIKYKTICFNAIYDRIDKHTFYFNELVLEAISVMKKRTNIEMSTLVSDLLLKQIDDEYLEEAKKNIYNRKPSNKQFIKSDRKLLKKMNIL